MTAAGGSTVRAQPFLQLGNTIQPVDESGNGNFGNSVGISGDGTTAVIGAPADASFKGAAWIFVRSNGIWQQDGVKLTGNGEVGSGEFGRSVAISSDGSTVLVGARDDDGGKGAVWVFARSGGGGFTPQAKLTPTDEANPGNFGFSVALSGDGNTAAIGGPSDQWQGANTSAGAAWVFTRSGSSWQQDGPKLTVANPGTRRALGWSVAVAADGRTVLAGGPGLGGSGFPTDPGAAWVFVRGATGWPQQGGGLTAGTAGDAFGDAVSLSADGNTAVIGAPFAERAWVYGRSGVTWSPQGPALSPGSTTGFFGGSVSLSADGNTALVGQPFENSSRGAFWRFAQFGDAWSRLDGPVEAGGENGRGSVGSSLALAADGNSAIVGALNDGLLTSSGAFGAAAGAAFPFGARPGVDSIAPVSGSTAGGTTVTITGHEFRNAASVRFGSAPARSYSVVSSGVIDAVAPAGAAGTVDVTVANSAGTSFTTSSDQFTYKPPAPSSPPSGTSGPDRQPPTAPETLHGSFARGTLVLGWLRSTDDRGVDHYELDRDGRLATRVATTTASLRGFATNRRTVFQVYAFDAAGNRSAGSNTLAVTPRRRPRGVPARIPAWAQRLYLWQIHGQKGHRPVTPKHLPAWYARWKAWRLRPYAIAG